MISDANLPSVGDYKGQHKHSLENLNGKESRASNEPGLTKDSRSKHNKNIKSDQVLKKALEPSEFKMRDNIIDNISPSRRMLEKKSRMKANRSKELNESPSELSSQKKLKRNESQRSLSKDQILAASDRNDNSKSKKLMKNLREHIALKLYEHNIPANNYHRVIGKGVSNVNNSYIQKMLDAYNVFNHPKNSHSMNKYNYKMRKNLRNQNNKSRLREDELKSLERNKSLIDKTNSRNEPSPGYPRENSVVLPELSRSPGVSLIGNRKKSIISLKKRQAEHYMRSGKRNKSKIASLSKAPNKSTDIEAMPSISKQLDRILNSHKLSIEKTGKYSSVDK